jgi:hypothetical protein
MTTRLQRDRKSADIRRDSDATIDGLEGLLFFAIMMFLALSIAALLAG